MIYRLILFLLMWNNHLPESIMAQTNDQQGILYGQIDLNTCINYALENHPVVDQIKIREQITSKTIASELSAWLPQIDLNANYQYYLLQPVSIFPDFNDPEGPKREVTTGVLNTSSLQFGATQTIYSAEVVSAGSAAKYYRRQVTQSSQQQLIELILGVSKAFYTVLLTEARMDIFLEDRVRIDRSYRDAYSLFETGLSDKIDYQRAQISLNNINAEIAGTREEIKARYASLKELMGYPVTGTLSIMRDSNIAEKAWIDTTIEVKAKDRIEYQLLATNIMIQHANVNYNRLQFLPSLSAFANYNLVYQHDEFEALYNRDFPNSLAGLRLNVPLFGGGRKFLQLKIAKLRLNELKLDSVILSNRINSEFETAMTSYKSNLKLLNASRQNAIIAEGIYNTVRLQYNQGIKSFLEVIVSEADLRTARINELNALYRLVTSKLDVDAALGRIYGNN
jgi:outer membrane protein